MAPVNKQQGRVRLVRVGKNRGDNGSSTGRVLSTGVKRIRVVEMREVISQVLDPFADKYREGDLIRPLYDPGTLAQFLDYSRVMSQCVNVLATNIDALGFHFQFVPPLGEKREPTPEEQQERAIAEFLFRYPNATESWIEIKKKLRADKCLIGYNCLEVVRNLGDEIAELHHAPAKTFRMTRPQEEPIRVKQWVEQASQWIEIEREVRFRKFCQLVGQKKTWFREFGDPRSMNKATGEFAGEDGRFPADQEASELIFDGYYSPMSNYGTPPWISVVLDIIGAHEAGSVNYLFFQQKTIPPFIVTVAGGSLGDNAADDIADYLEDQFKGVDNWNKILVLEAFGQDTGQVEGEQVTPVSIEVKPLAQFLPNDAQFLKYIHHADKGVRESFQLPPILLGAAEEYSHAAVRVALTMAEQQVFQPQRSRDDTLINTKILADLGVRSWIMVSHGVPTSDDTQIVKALAALPELVPVGHGVDYISDLMGKQPPQLDESIRGMLLGELRANLRSIAAGGFLPGGDNSTEVENQLIAGLRQVRDAIVKSRRNRS